MTEQELKFAAGVFGYSRNRMEWALEEQQPGECGFLGGCHAPADPGSASGYCTGHETYLASHRERAGVA